MGVLGKLGTSSNQIWGKNESSQDWRLISSKTTSQDPPSGAAEGLEFPQTRLSLLQSTPFHEGLSERGRGSLSGKERLLNPQSQEIFKDLSSSKLTWLTSRHRQLRSC